jgi:MoaA/NifB/PqqE/SkfB family radical SAM enzyme
LNLRDPLLATVDADGRLVLPPEIVTKLGLQPGTTVPLDEEPNSVRVRRPIEQLAKVYVEPTSRCNLTCRTCIRNAWEEPLGDMSEETFGHLLKGLTAFDPPPAVFFGGFGEPLAHPGILEMVARVKALGAPKVELITNGCLLGRETARGLIEAGLDTLWVSLDGIRPESYGDVRLGALLPQVLENLQGFKEVRREIQVAGLTPEERTTFETGIPGLYESWRLPEPTPGLGIVFVAMKRNIADLPGVIAETYKLGARQYIVSNVIPYTEELIAEILYKDTLEISPLPTLWHDLLRLPPMDITEETRRPLWAVLHGRHQASFEGGDASGTTRRCPFVEAGSTSIAWSGGVSACPPLLHTHNEYLRRRKREVTRYVVGNLHERSLHDIWFDPEYVAFRKRVQGFDFAPCISCGGCGMSDGNEEDCEDDIFPRCGACLWSQGLVRCP